MFMATILFTTRSLPLKKAECNDALVNPGNPSCSRRPNRFITPHLNTMAPNYKNRGRQVALSWVALAKP